MIFVKCPHCRRGFVGFSRKHMYVRMFTHFRLRHWDHYLIKGGETADKLSGLIG